MVQEELPPVYLSGDDRLAAIICEFGRPVTREELYAIALRVGISDATVHQSLKHSNVLTGIENHYSVVGNNYSANA